MTSSALASRYAGALVDVVLAPRAQADPQQVTRELRSFEGLLTESHDLQHALASPAVAPGRKKAVVARLGERLGMSRVSRNFLFVLIDHRRMDALRDVVDAFEILLDERLGFARAEVISARALDERRRETLSRTLEELTGKKIRSRFSVDPALIGGVIARIGSTVYDGSVRGQLQELGRRLATE